MPRRDPTWAAVRWDSRTPLDPWSIAWPRTNRRRFVWSSEIGDGYISQYPKEICIYIIYIYILYTHIYICVCIYVGKIIIIIVNNNNNETPFVIVPRFESVLESCWSVWVCYCIINKDDHGMNGSWFISMIPLYIMMEFSVFQEIYIYVILYIYPISRGILMADISVGMASIDISS